MDRIWTERPGLDGEQFDVAVIGGGINGVAIARECARAGSRTLLVEQHDFASGTTSRSTRIIHGGLRYMEYGEMALVRESLRERERLLRERPHLVRPLHFLLAMRPGGGRNAMLVRAGLWLYRTLAGGRKVEQRAGESCTPSRAKAARAGDPAPASTPAAESRRRLEQFLDAGGQWALFSYDDAQCEFPERLVAEWLREALASGAVARNYTQAVNIERRGGQVRALLLRDLLTGAEQRVEANWIINATGPWADFTVARSGVDTVQPMVGGVRGSHIVLPQFEGAPRTAVFAEALDRRPIFLVPWNQQLLVGTTEVPDHGDPARTQPSDDEVAYLLGSVNKLFPRAQVSHGDIAYAFAGVRPLPYSPGVALSAVTRQHMLHDHGVDGAVGLISVIGGKLTTAASLARECARTIGLKAPEPRGAVAVGPSQDEIEQSLLEWSRGISHLAGISKSSARAIAEWHGARALCIARLASRDPHLRQPLCPHTPHLVAEAVDAVIEECAVTLADILLRRVPVALGRCWSRECSRDAAARIGEALRWTCGRIEYERERFEAERDSFLVRPAPVAASGELPVGAESAA